MDRITSMTTFAKVVDVGSFSAAARALHSTPSMVTQHVQSLEERLGVRLLNRSTRKLSLTEVGQDYYARCVHILTKVDDAERLAQSLQSSPSGTLRLNTSIAMPLFIAPTIAAFVERYPDVLIDTTMTDKSVDLVQDGFDLAIRHAPIPDSSLIARRVATYRYVACASPDYLTRQGTPRQPADLVNHNCLRYAHAIWGSEWRFTGDGGEQTIIVSGNLRSNSALELRLAAMRGQGIYLTPRFLVADELNSGRLCSVLDEFLCAEHAIIAIYPHRNHLSAKVRAFIDCLSKVVGTTDLGIRSPIRRRSTEATGREPIAGRMQPQRHPLKVDKPLNQSRPRSC
jgi:DNA-binding transcriptional LysR family regulator